VEKLDRIDHGNGKVLRKDPASKSFPLELESSHNRAGVATRLPVNSLRGEVMPEKRTIENARKRKREGKSPSTQAGEFVREEIHHIREGKHGARSPEQAIAIGLSKARRAGVNLRAPKKGKASAATRRSAKSALKAGHSGGKPSSRRSQAVRRALRHEGGAAASHSSLSRQARSAARKRGPRNLSAAAKKAVRTKGRSGRVAAARKAARTRARQS
jgi:hypothetical protein